MTEQTATTGAAGVFEFDGGLGTKYGGGYRRGDKPSLPPGADGGFVGAVRRQWQCAAVKLLQPEYWAAQVSNSGQLWAWASTQ